MRVKLSSPVFSSRTFQLKVSQLKFRKVQLEKFDVRCRHRLQTCSVQAKFPFQFVSAGLCLLIMSAAPSVATFLFPLPTSLNNQPILVDNEFVIKSVAGVTLEFKCVFRFFCHALCGSFFQVIWITFSLSILICFNFSEPSQSTLF